MDKYKLTPEEWHKIRTSRPSRRKLSHDSFDWFFHIYMFNYIKHDTADFQREMMSLASDPKVEHLVVCAFRESGKSTLITTALPIWAVTGSLEKKYVVIVSQTQVQAQQHLANIRLELESNELLHKDFWPVDYEENTLGVSAINIPKYGARIIAVSREQGVRGLRHGSSRPDLIIADDVEDSRTVKNKESRNNNFAWFTGELIPLGSDNTKFVTVGNLLHEDSLLMRLRAGIEDGQRDGVYREYPLLKKNKPLWSARFPNKAAVKKLERKIGDQIRFQREYLLHLVPEEDQLITRDMIEYYDELPELPHGKTRQLVVGVDLAISQKDAADLTAMVTLDVRGQGNSLRMYVLPNPINKKMNFNKTMDVITEMNVQLGFPKFYVETVAYQQALLESIQKGEINAKGVVPNTDKRTRLNMIADKIERGIILFPKHGVDALIEQLVGFGIERYDDLVDALTMAVTETIRDQRSSGTITFGRYDIRKRF